MTTLIAILIASLVLSGCQLKFPLSKQAGSTVTQSQSPETQLETPKKSAHFESSTPVHGSILAGVPKNVVINFNFDLAKSSEIKITKDGKEYAVGETIIDTNLLTLRRNMEHAAPDGLYTVNYNACWPDGSCHDGNFQFVINREVANNFQDMTGKKEIVINLKNFMIEPKNVKISKGTKVTWTNSDSAIHYINTDSHPAHTYVLDMNSKAIDQNGSYSYTFNQTGIYPYHCSAHANTMTANILVE